MSFVLTDEEQEAVDRGEAATSLLNNPMFLYVIDHVRSQCAEAILTSDPAAKDAREDAYNLSRGLSAITVELRTLESHAEQILAQASTISDDDHQPDVIAGDY